MKKSILLFLIILILSFCPDLKNAEAKDLHYPANLTGFGHKLQPGSENFRDDSDRLEREIINSAIYYVATNGNDNNPGTFTQPFATWQRGFTAVNPGDTVFIRGGIYYPVGNSIRIFDSDFYCGAGIKNKDGSAEKLISILAYPGEKPVLDCRKITDSAFRAGIVLIDCDYWYLEGLEIAHADQVPGFGAHGIYLNSCNNNTLEKVISHDIGGIGIRIGYASEGNLLLNCDAYNCYDPYSMSGEQAYHGGHADGIAISDIFERDGNERINSLIGCRVWNNSDDGYDFYKCEGIIVMDHCWAWKNGYDNGDGNGFKLGITIGRQEKIAQRILTHCISFSNREIGFDQNVADVKMILYNCVSFDNGTYGFNFQWNNNTDILRNNITYRNGRRDIFSPGQIHDHNSWDSKIRITDADFISLSQEGVDGPRQLDGKLPQIKFLHLAEDSDLRGAGINTGHVSDYDPFIVNGNPDIGAFQYHHSETKSKSSTFGSWLRMLLILWPAMK